MHDQLTRIERKLDLVLQLQGVELEEIAQINTGEDAALAALTAKLKASADALKAATDAAKKAT